MFLDEARIAAAIDHPNVARIFELGEQHGTLYFVMEYVVGDSLMRLRRAMTKDDSPFPPAIALRIAADAASGLHAAHELRDPARGGVLLEVVHRDISPQNTASRRPTTSEQPSSTR